MRYFHEPLSGEFANVGVLLWAPESQQLLFRATEKFSRLSKFFADFHKDDYRKLIQRIDTRFRELGEELAESAPSLVLPSEPQSARDLAIQVVPVDAAALQWSLSAGGLCESPQAEIDDISERLIECHYSVLDNYRRDEGIIFRTVYRPVFRRERIQKHISPHEIVAPLARHTFDQAWKNGVWNVYQPLSFDLVKAEDVRHKAHRWFGESQFLAQAKDEHRLHFLLGKPADDRHEKAFGDAKKILDSSKSVVLVEEDEVEDFANQLEQEIVRSFGES